MLSIKRTKELLNDHDISDEKAEKIRDDFRMLAEIIFEKWQQEKKMDTKQKVYPQKHTLPKKENLL